MEPKHKYLFKKLLFYFREKPGDAEYVALDMKKVPLLLNYSQCKLFLQDYYAVIEHTTEVINKDPGIEMRNVMC